MRPERTGTAPAPPAPSPWPAGPCPAARAPRPGGRGRRSPGPAGRARCRYPRRSSVGVEPAGEPLDLGRHRVRARRRPAWCGGTRAGPAPAGPRHRRPRSGWASTSSASGTWRSEAVPHQRAHQGVGVPERHAPLDQQLGQVDRGGVRRVGGRPASGRVSNVSVAYSPVERRQGQRHLVDRVEQRLLVLLEVPVVAERQALERGQQPGQVADDPAGLAPGQLGDVGVLLLRAASTSPVA